MTGLNPLSNRIEWIKRMTPITHQLLSAIKGDMTNKQLVFVGHINDIMVPFLEHYLNLGLKLSLSPAVPGVVYPDCMEYLKSKGAQVVGDKASNWDELESSCDQILDQKPEYIVDTGGGLIVRAIERDITIKAACEVTGSGISKIEKVYPNFPVFNFDDIPEKDLLHNRYGVAGSVWYGFRHFTKLDISRMNVLVLGFGPVGQSIAHVARGHGAIVTVNEVNPLRKTIARSEGFPSFNLHKSIELADVIVTATGQNNVLDRKDLSSAKDGVFLLNAGHDNREFNLDECQFIQEIMPEVQEYKLNSKTLYLLGNGKLLNLVAGGTAINSFDYITAYFAKIVDFLINYNGLSRPGLNLLPHYVVKNVLK